jgi:hypothetical protein
MNERRLKRLLRANHPVAEGARWGCPSEIELAAYADQRLPASKRAHVEAHLAACDACLAQVAFLARMPEPAAVPPDLLSRASALPVAGWRPRLALRWGTAAAAACLVLAVGLRLALPTAPPEVPRHTEPSATTTPSSPPPHVASSPAVAPEPPRAPAAAVRKSGTTPSVVVLLSPRENGSVSPLRHDFLWQAVPGALYYELQILTEDGTVVWQASSDGTAVRLPGGHPLRAGEKYFAWVRAHLATGGTLRSAAVSFHVGAP